MRCSFERRAGANSLFGGEGEIDSGHPGPRASRAVAKALRRPKSLQAILSNSLFGGEGEIRTHEGCETLPVFKTGAFNRSATSPKSLESTTC